MNCYDRALQSASQKGNPGDCRESASPNNPPETRQALERLLATGYSRKVAKEMIGAAVVEEIWHISSEKKPSDPKRLKALLDKPG